MNGADFTQTSRCLRIAFHLLLEKVSGRNPLSAVKIAVDLAKLGTVEALCRRADGREYLATIFFGPVPDEEGVISQHYLSFLEVGGSISWLLPKPDQFSALYEHAPGFVAVLEGPEHRFAYANASYKRLVGKEKLVGERMVDQSPEYANEKSIGVLDGVFNDGVPYFGENERLRIFKGGQRSSQVHYLNFQFQPVRDNKGEITGIFIEGYDVTAEHIAAKELSLLQGELAHASRVNAMGMMAATLAHELNQPLAAISSYAGSSFRLVESASPHAASLAEALREIESAAQRAGDIIRNVRDLTKRGDTPKATFNLIDAIAECVRLVRAGDCFASTVLDRTQSELTVTADRIQIQQVVINLLRNACEATRATPAGLVTVDATLGEGEVIVSVTDTGPGISLKAAADIFAWADSSKEGGAGLGLAICRTIIESHHGRIWLERSNASGSQFCFSIPTCTLDGGEGDGA